MFYNDYYWGMNFVWWFIWIVLIFWIFALPYDIPGQRSRKDSPFDILRKRFASGEITIEEYHEKKRILGKT
jgi:putative membrane protein